MDAGQLHELARELRRIASHATSRRGDSKGTPGQLAIATDLATHGPSTISQIVGRTGLAQSYVSKVTATLVKEGIAHSSSDPQDGRKTVISLDTFLLQDLRDRARINIESSLTDIRPDLIPQEKRDLLNLLEDTYKILYPQH